MRIAQLANFYSETSGGLRVAVDTVRSGYLGAGHDVALIVPGVVARTIRRDEYTTYEIPSFSVGAGYRMARPGAALDTALSDFAPDRLEISDKATMIQSTRWARRRGVPTVLWSHERLDHALAAHLPTAAGPVRLAAAWTRRLGRMVDTVVCASQYGVDEFRAHGVTRVQRVPLGVDLLEFTPRPTLDSSIAQLVCVGRLSPEKRPDLAVEALRTLTGWGFDAHLTMVGDGPLRRHLQAQAAGLPVSFTGHISERSEVSRRLAAADVTIAPCPGECFGLAALEAMACGTPVVVTERSGAAELVVDGSGSVAPASPRGIALAIEHLLESPRSVLRKLSRSRAEQFPWSRTIAGMLDVHGAAAVAT